MSHISLCGFGTFTIYISIKKGELRYNPISFVSQLEKVFFSHRVHFGHPVLTVVVLFPSLESMGAEIKRRTRSLREKTGKKPGGQLGHKGNTRLMTDTPDETEEVQPNYCRECGRDLSDVEGTEEYA